MAPSIIFTQWIAEHHKGKMWLIHPHRLSLSMAYGSAPLLTPHPHPSPHTLTQCLLNIALQKVLLDCVSRRCLHIEHFTLDARGCMFSRETFVYVWVFVYAWKYVFCKSACVSGRFIFVFSQSETRGGVCRSPLPSSATGLWEVLPPLLLLKSPISAKRSDLCPWTPPPPAPFH